jgi:hypothetical protein
VQTYLLMRIAVGLLGVAVPFLLVFLEPLVFDDRPFPLGSLSAYYYSGAREVFVGALCTIGFFLIVYKLAVRSWETTLSTVAGFLVIVVALFPTSRPGNGVPLTALQDLLSETTVERVHFIAAGIFIFLLAIISFLFAKRSPEKGRMKRQFWVGFHRTCGTVILAALGLCALEGLTGWPDRGLLYGEFVAVLSFGVSWLAKGADFKWLRASEDVPEDAAAASTGA